MKDVPVSEVNEMVSRIQLNNHLVDFIQKNHDRSSCYREFGCMDDGVTGSWEWNEIRFVLKRL